MPGLLKVGYTMNTVEGRVAELSSATGVPSPFLIVYQVECRDPEGIEASVHRSLVAKRHNNGREFFRVSVEEAVAEIRRHAKEIIGEEFGANFASLRISATGSLDDYRRERIAITDWVEFDNLYLRTFVSRSKYHRENDDSIVVWQMLSVHSNKKMREYQSVIAKNRYLISRRSVESIYSCHFSLPMGDGEITFEKAHSGNVAISIAKGSPSEVILGFVQHRT